MYFINAANRQRFLNKTWLVPYVQFNVLFTKSALISQPIL